MTKQELLANLKQLAMNSEFYSIEEIQEMYLNKQLDYAYNV